MDKDGQTTLAAETQNQFTVETVQEAGSVTVNAGADYAVVVVGAPTVIVLAKEAIEVIFTLEKTSTN